MPKLTERATNRVLKALRRAGWNVRSATAGSHYVLVNRQLPGIVVVPRHPRVKKGTLSKIIKQAGLTPAEFEKLYR